MTPVIAWAEGDADDGAAYLAQHRAAAHARLARGDALAALNEADRILSLLASLENPQAARPAVAAALADAIGVLTDLGQTERAYGLYRVAGAFTAANVPAEDAAAWRVTEARLKDLVGAAASAEPRRQAGSVQSLVEAAMRAGGAPGAWYRPGATERGRIGAALAEGNATPEAAFVLFQLAGRTGPSFDADALTALGQARDALQRRTIHETLRLVARRDRLEREQVQAMIARGDGAASTGRLRHDRADRLAFRDFAVRIDQAERELTRAGITLSGANVAPLARLQAVLSPDEAALITAPTPDGLAYMCVRRDATFQARAAADPGRLKVDIRLLQLALSDTRPPSPELDSQFPAAAAVRLYDVLVRPLEPCLKPGDRIVWLPDVASVGFPLAALLPEAPPKLGEGYDLSAARWLVRDHAVSYAGSASALVAARSGGADAPAFDFLGVGDPLLTGQTDDGQARGAVVLRGVRGGSRFADLAPLPDTKLELEASAKGFRTPRLLTEAAATERRFRGELTGSYRYLSFATHGLLRDDLQGLSEPALVLTPVSTADPLDDGLLTASEIADLNLSASFAALSACNTANFDLGQMAEDLPALASAFAVAGVPSTLGTLWPVDSETGRTVVAGVFATLRVAPGKGPAEALAAAQRAFLAAPPSAAYLHPRFWAPFVILGDGGPARPEPPSPGALKVASVEVLTRTGGEVLDVRRGPDGVAARFVSDADTRGRHAAGVRVAGERANWRRDNADGAAIRFSADLGRTLIVGGYAAGPDGVFHPTLESFDAATGAPLKAWRGEGPADAFVLGGAKAGPDRALVVVGEALRTTAPARAVRVFEVGADLQPRLVFETRTPRGAELNRATIATLGGDLVLTYSQAFARTAGAAATDDDYDAPLCTGEPVTWVEVRDGRSGTLKASREIHGLQVNAALARGGEALLGGSANAACGAEARAVVWAINVKADTRAIYADETLGQSMVWALGALPAGRTFVAASKQTVVDFPAVRAAAARSDIYRPKDLQRANNGMVLTLAPDGTPSAPRMLDSGSTVFVDGADSSRPDDILLGGSLGGQAAIFHLGLVAR